MGRHWSREGGSKWTCTSPEGDDDMGAPDAPAPAPAAALDVAW